ncbi:MAG: calcium/sodium antiporter [Chloroflexi bacterium]|nr:calcium/sodium antiporter [Chloroflexota bacterium]MDA1296980.1 calcium/sodium antiporter [Chloroflexota bacterium]
MNILDLILFLAGLVLLVVGAEGLVRGATRLGRLAGLSPLVVGLTIVSFATTTPEASVSIVAAADGRGGLAVGNVLGSNIFNILVVAGAAATIIAIPVSNITIRKDLPVLIIATAVVYLLAVNGTVVEWEGILLLLALAGFITFSILQSRRTARATRESFVTRTRRAALNEMGIGVVFSGAGAALLILGSRLFVNSASDIASALGVSELIIGLTIVAAGTSAPELTTAIVAALRGETDLAIGNAVGASVINVLGVIGASALVSGGGLIVPSEALRLDFPVAVTVGIVVLSIVIIGKRAGRRDGLLMLGFYAIYLSTLIAISINADLLTPASIVALGVVLPVSVITAGYLIFRSVRSKAPARLEVPFVDR